MSGPGLPLHGWVRLRRSGAMAMDNPDQPGDVIAVVPPKTYELPPRVPKTRAEDVQIASFTRALGQTVGEQVTWERGSDQDAPDRTITIADQRWEIELTALTAGKLRAERKRLSDVAELVRDAVAAQPDLSAVLTGWTVDLSDAADLPMPDKSGAPATAACITTHLAVLASASAGRPLPCNGDMRAAAQDGPGDPRGTGAKADTPHSADGIQVRLIRSGAAEMRILTHAPQASVTLSEARRMLHDRLLDKDKKMRENVVVCAGDPDRDGLVLPLDVTAFELLALFGCGELPPMRWVKSAWLHLTGTAGLISLIRVGNPELPNPRHRRTR
jgi:hypothetical protein